MTITLTAREFNQDTARAKREAASGPVFVTDRGQPTHVLLTVEEYEKLRGPKRTLAEMLYMPGMEEIDMDFEIPDRKEFPREVDFDFEA